MAGKATAANGQASEMGHTLEGVEWEGYAPAALPSPGGFLGRMTKLTRSEIGWDFGNGMQYPLVLNFTAVSGEARDKDGNIFPLEVGKEYGLWLIHTVILNSMKEAKLSEGELFGVKTNGRKLKRGGDPTNTRDFYEDYSVAYPERVKADNSVSWDEA